MTTCATDTGHIACFADFLALLGPGMELFHYSACDLRERYGAVYEADVVDIFRSLTEFARHSGDDPRDVLAGYVDWVSQAAAERAAGPLAARAGEAPGGLPEDAAFRRRYLYALTLSTLLNRSRYELLRHFRRAVAERVPPGAEILEIGAGNCLDAAFASRFGRVSAYEMNDLSRIWHDLLAVGGQAHQVDLRIEQYRFDEPRRFQFVAMVELLEHVADPAAYLRGARYVLAPDGHAFFTFAVRMPQFDHLTYFSSLQECRDLLSDTGFEVCDEQCLVDTYQPFAEEDRWRLGKDPRYAVVYSCLARQEALQGSAEALQDFNREID
jgi:SAM-dependent methyltransferase